MKKFYENVDEFFTDLAKEDPARFAWNMKKMTEHYQGSGKFSPHSGGSCTSSNCFGTTGCHKTTQNGACGCVSEDGPCQWFALP